MNILIKIRFCTFHPNRLGAEKNIAMVVTTNIAVKTQKNNLSITMAANFQSPISSAAAVSSFIFLVMNLSSFSTANSSCRVLLRPFTDEIVDADTLQFELTL